MKKTLAFLLSLALIFSALPIMMASAEEPAKGSLESFVKLSDGAELVTSTDNHLKSGEVCFTVSLPKNGYAQFDQQLSKLISSNVFDDSKRIVVKVGDRTQNDYIYSNFYVQLTASEDASSDIVPVDEPNGVEPGTKAITYHFYGPADNPGSIYGVNKGSSQVGAEQFSLLSTIESHSVPMCFTKETDGKLTVSQRYGGQYPNLYAYRKCKSTHTLSEIGGDDGVYVRLRNGESVTQTYTVYIISPDVTTAYKDGNVFLSKDGKLNSFDTALANGKIKYTYSVTLPGGGYAQLDRKFTDIATGGTLSTNVTPDSGLESDYKYVYLQVQLANDKHAANDIVPVKELATPPVEPGTDGMTWYFYGAGTLVYNGKGSSTGVDLTNTTNMAANGLGLSFTKNEDGTVKGTYILSKSLNSTHTLSEIASDGGVYLRIRNASSAEHTYKVVVTGSYNPYTDGKFKFSDDASKLISSRTYFENGYMVETATVKLSGNGGYVQLDRKYCDLANGKTIYTYLKPGKGETADYIAMRAQIQLTKDKSALTDIVPVVEYQNPTPPTDGMTWLYYGQSNIIYTGTGSNTAGGSCSAAPTNNTYLENGAIMNLEKTAEGKIKGTYPSFGSCTSKRTLAEIDGNDGIYLRVRNALSVAEYYTFIFKSTVADIDCDGIAGTSDLVLIRKMILGVSQELAEADFNGDNKVNILDLVKYKKLIAE